MPEQTRKARRSRYSMYMRGRWREIRLSKSVMSALNNPSYIRFWWSESDRTIFVSAAQAGEAAAIAISDACYRRKMSVWFSKRLFLNCVAILTGWENTAYRLIPGEFVPELRMVAFKIDEECAEVAENG